MFKFDSFSAQLNYMFWLPLTDKRYFWLIEIIQRFRQWLSYYAGNMVMISLSGVGTMGALVYEETLCGM